MNSDEELLLRAAEERHAIVEKYRKGRHGGADIPAWEEPSYDIYQQLDRYGFIQDEKNQEVLSPKEIELGELRVKKWIKMINNWDKLSVEKLRKRVYKGIPDKCRSTAWMLLLNVGKYQPNQIGFKNSSSNDRGKLDQSNQKFRDRRKKYEEMRDLAWKFSPDIRQIDLDVNRTYREHIMFRDRYSSKQQELFNVLAAYSLYNMEIGYCQGMSQIVALLLMYLDEERAFWALCSLVSDTKYSMHGFFIPGFPKLLRFQEHHDKIMNKFIPQLKKHLDKNSVDTGIYTLKWFFQCFLDRIPFKLTLRVWDIYLLEGDCILSAMAYNLLKMHKEQLLRLTMDDILYFIQVKMEKQYQFGEDVTIENLQKCLVQLKRYKLDHAGKATPAELPKTPLGLFKPDAYTMSFEHKIGRRTEFSSTEKETQETVISRRDTAARLASLPDRTSSIGTDASSKVSLEPSLDDASSLANGGSRRSLADTSITSTADISHASPGLDSHSDVEVLIHSAGPSTPRASPSKSPTHLSNDRIRIYVPYESPYLSPKKSPPRHQNSHDSDATIINSNGTVQGATLSNSYSTSYIPPVSTIRQTDTHRSISNPTSLYEQYESNKITIHIVDDNLATPLSERIPNSVSSPFHVDPGMIHMHLK